MELFLYLCFVYLFRSTQANSTCDQIITPITSWDPYKIPDNPPPCKSRNIWHKEVRCKTTSSEPFVLTFKNDKKRTRLACYIHSDTPGIVGQVKIQDKECTIQTSILKLVSDAPEITLKFRTQSEISLSCLTIEDYPNVFHTESKEVDSREKGKGPATDLCDCGISKKTLSNRIINGTNVANIKEYPWMVSVEFKDRSVSLYPTPRCGGSIITRRHVITAASCVVQNHIGGWFPFTYFKYSVRVGIIKSTPEVLSRARKAVKNVFRHEKYDPSFKHDDIAILELVSKIHENEYTPICIPKKFLPRENQQLTTLGWGKMGIPDTQKQPEKLKKTHVRLLDPGVCEKLFPEKFLKDSQICTFSKHSSVAKKDSGGPWMYVDPKTNRYNLVGITSYRTDLVDLMPGAQTAVHHYFNWIKKIIKSKTSDDICNISLIGI